MQTKLYTVMGADGAAPFAPFLDWAPAGAVSREAASKEYLQDPRITTELVDHMPTSATVSSPLKFLGRIPGKPGEVTYARTLIAITKRSRKPPRGPTSG